MLVLGTSGAGKSTLINTVIGKDVAEVGVGNHVTERAKSYVSDELNFNLIDSRGFEYSYWNTRKSVKDMRSWIRQGMKEEEHRIHIIGGKLFLNVNRMKTEVAHISKVKYLGYTFYRYKGKTRAFESNGTCYEPKEVLAYVPNPRLSDKK